VLRYESDVLRLYCGNAADELRALPDESIQCCVTSPPYFGLRDYGVKEQIGLEQSPDEYVSQLVAAFREVHRVLRKDGTLWLNLGDSYGRGKRVENVNDHKRGTNRHAAITEANAYGKGVRKAQLSKNLLGIPWRVAFALQADGWYLRQDIIWHKPNPMPESVRDRCTKAHEYIFLLAKSPRYYFDAKAIAEPLLRPDEANRKTPAKFGGANKHVEAGKQSRLHSGNEYLGTTGGTRNKRSVWTVAPKPYKGAHFATFPPALIEPCILAGSKPGDTVLDLFGGSGTTAEVAIKHGRRAVLIELNSEYIKLQRARLKV
jgi:DNA modification methylase